MPPPPRPATPGALPADGPATVAGVELPPGRRIAPAPGRWARADEAPAVDTPPVLWLTDDQVDDAGARWSALVGAFPTTGLWPVLLEGLRGDDARPWDEGELSPRPTSSIDAVDVERFLRERWPANDEGADEDAELLELLAPFGSELPGLVDTEVWPPRPDFPSSVVPGSLTYRVGLVPATRPADVLTILGWEGPVNHFLGPDDLAGFSAVLRSWEDRFGAWLLALGFDTLALVVERSPGTVAQAERVAAEHVALCPDNVFQGAGDLRAYAGLLLDQPGWSFWWD